MEAATHESSHGVGGVKQLDHFAMPAMDLERAEKFYTEVLGTRLIVKGEPAVPGGMFLKIGRRHHLGLFLPINTKATLPKRDTVDSYPRVAFVLSPAEFDKASVQVKKHCSVVMEIEEEGVSATTRKERGIAFIDSEGNILELFKGKEDNPIAVDHLHFDSLSIEDGVGFYKDVLNFELVKQTAGKAILAIPTGQAIVLHQVKELCEVTKTYYDERHFAFSVSDEDFHAIVENLHRKGIREADELGGGVKRKPGDLGTYFKDPTNGIYLQLLNRDSTIFARKFGFPI